MQPFVANLTDQVIEDLAAHYAALSAYLERTSPAIPGRSLTTAASIVL